jgi:hypothetical protein
LSHLRTRIRFVIAGAVIDTSTIGGALTELSFFAALASGSPAPPTVRDAMLADFLASPRADPDPDEIARHLRDVM